MTIRAPSETALVRACLQLLALRRIFAWRNNTGALRQGKRLIRFGCVGSPDILGILPAHQNYPPGRHLAIECKVGRNGNTPAQEAWQQAARQAGALVLLVRSIDELDFALEAMGI